MDIEREKTRAALAAILKDQINKTSDDYLFSKLDSLAVIKLIMGLEKGFGIKFIMPDFTEKNFKDFPTLEEFISGKIHG